MELDKAIEILKQWYEDDEAADREYYLRSHDMYCTVRDAGDRIAELEAELLQKTQELEQCQYERDKAQIELFQLKSKASEVETTPSPSPASERS